MMRILVIVLLIGFSGVGSVRAQSFQGYTPSCCTTPTYASAPAYSNSPPSYPSTPVSATATVSPPTTTAGQVNLLPQVTTLTAPTYSPPAYTGPNY